LLLNIQKVLTTSKMKGTVVKFIRRKGFGFIQPNKEGEKQVFVHWSEIHTDEQWPNLESGQEVQFTLKEEKGKRSAEKVTKLGGGKIKNKEDERDIDEETIYTGTVKFFDSWKGFGFIIPDEEIEYGGQTATTSPEDGGVYVSRDDIIIAEGSDARLNPKTKVQFQVYKGKTSMGACMVQNEDGTPYEYKQSNKRKRKSKGETNKKAKTD